MADGQPAVYKAACLASCQERTSENGPLHLDQPPTSRVICERKEEEEVRGRLDPKLTLTFGKQLISVLVCPLASDCLLGT